ncbi:MAG TPA: hypothetical protein PKZ84_10170 [Anaerolineae bacterium]|nr:hypothetical protein [Anaerolineae bacterium]HQI85000.1 hypothetical protein [Anaerolineae bacterium]
MTDEIKIEIHGLEELTRLLDEFGNLEEAVYFPLREAMSQAVQLIEARAKQNLTDNASVASGALRAMGVGSNVEVTPTALTGIVYADIRRNGVNYAEAVEFGTRKGYIPPLEPLIEWVRLKGLTGVVTLARGRLKRARQQSAIEQLARQVQWGIYYHGTAARPFFEPAVEASRAEILQLFEDAVTQIIAHL